MSLPHLASVPVPFRTPSWPSGPSAVPAARPAADRRWDLLLACVALYILSAVGRIHQLFPPLEIVHPALLSGVLAIAMFTMDGRDSRRLTWIWLAPTKCLLALFVWMVLSIPTALVLGNSVDFVLNNFLKTVVMSLVVAASIRGLRDVERLLFIYFAGATIYAVVAIARFDLGAGAQWRLGHLYYYDANDLATFLVTAMPFGLLFLGSARRLSTRVFTGVSLVVLMLAFVRTGSRSGFLALAAVTIFVLLRYTSVTLWKRGAATALIAVAVVALASDRYWDQMTTIVQDDDYNRTEETGRIHIWARGIGYMLQNPVFGVGADNFQAAEGRLSPLAQLQQFGVGVAWNAAHNSYVQTGAELGIPGVTLFVSLIGLSLYSLRRWHRRLRLVEAGRAAGLKLSQVLTASLIGFTVGACFLSLAYHEILYTLIALSVGLIKTGRLRLASVTHGRQR